MVVKTLLETLKSYIMDNYMLLDVFETYLREYQGCSTQEQIDRELDRFIHCHELVVKGLK